jgi:hypothetical protein
VNTHEASGSETERMMKLQDVLLKAMAKKITRWEAAEIIGVADRREGRPMTWMLQGRLPQELRLAGIGTVSGANEFLSARYIGEFNEKFKTEPADKGTAFRRTARADLDWIFTVQTERVVAKDNTATVGDRILAIGEESVPELVGRLYGHGPPALERNRVDPLRPARGGTIQRTRGGPTETGGPWKSRAGGAGGKPKSGFPPSPAALGNPAAGLSGLIS